MDRDDIVRAIKSLKSLGTGFELVTVGQRKLVQSVPRELNKDHNEILALAQVFHMRFLVECYFVFLFDIEFLPLSPTHSRGDGSKPQANSGYVTMRLIKERLKWDADRLENAVNNLLREGIAWVDEQANPQQYWIASLFDQ